MLETAINAALKAGKAILEIYNSGDFSIETKADNSPLTEADLAAHELIKYELLSTKIPLLSEEGNIASYEEREQWSKLWIVDPIDGTKEFIKRNGEFTVNIALIENQIPILGVIYVPVKEILYFGDANGAFKLEQVTIDNYSDRRDNAIKLPISRESDNKTYTVVASKSHLSQETEDFIEELKTKVGEIALISKGSSLKLCMVAEGIADCYPRFAPTMEWDTAAGQAICMAAGKNVIDWQTKQTMLYNRPNMLNSWFLVQ